MSSQWILSLTAEEDSELDPKAPMDLSKCSVFEERKAWDLYVAGLLSRYGTEQAARMADDLIKKRRERFGKPLGMTFRAFRWEDDTNKKGETP